MIEQFLRQLMETVLGWLPESLHNPLIYLLAAAACLLALLVALGLLFRIVRIRWQTPIVHRVRLQNTGNVPGYFWLGAVAPGHDLKFEYFLEGARLAVKKAAPQAAAARPAQTGAVPVTAVASAQPVVQAAPAPAALPAGAPPPASAAKGVKEGATKGVEKAGDASKKAFGIAQAFSGIFGALGALLPGSLGQPFREASVKTQMKMAQGRNVMDAPEQSMRSVDALKGQAGNLKKTAGAVPAPAGAGSASRPTPAGSAPAVPASTAWPGAVQTVPAPAGPAQVPVHSPAAPAVIAAEARPEMEIPEYVELKALKPEAALEVEVRIRPLSQYHSGESVYWLLARQLPPASLVSPNQPAPDWLPQEQELAQKVVQRFYVRGAAQFYRLTTALLALLALELNLLWVLPVVRWLLQFLKTS